LRREKMMTPKQSILYRKWKNILDNKKHMEELILKLMANPATEDVHMAQAHAMYADVCKRLSDVSHHIDNILRTGHTTGLEIEDVTCNCGYTGKRIKGAAYRCPECGMY
jgi:predicted Zn-ribbon and HTH transcriptional regulator